MIFCGQCGLQLAPGDVRCPRCGAVTDAGSSGVAVEDPHTDDPTIEVLPYVDENTQRTVESSTPGNPQKLVLRPDGVNYENEAYEATNRVGAADYLTHRGMSYPGYAPLNSNDYPAQGTSYPGYAPQQEGAFVGQYRSNAPIQRKKGRTAALVVILLGLLLVLGAMVLFALQHNGILNFGGTASNPTPTATTVTLTPVQQGRAVVQQYYDDVNSKDYQGAYNLWKSDPTKPTFATFKAGYAHTERSDLTITSAVLQSDGTVKVNVTLHATEDAVTGNGTQHSIYKGSYIVQQQADGTWLIQRGTLKKV